MSAPNPYRIFPLGDAAITLDFGNLIDSTINAQVISLFHSLQREPLDGMSEAVPAYSSLTIYYDVYKIKSHHGPHETASEWMMQQLERRLKSFSSVAVVEPKAIRVPVCYEKEFGWDIEEISIKRNIAVERIIEIHISSTYRVFMLGFLPGFTYMGEVDKQIEMPRRDQPRQRVEAGSVGIAGRQTGIYPLPSPGGWQIIGRTPLKIFDASQNVSAGEAMIKNSICLFQPGDMVQFYSISKDEFENY